MNPIVYYFLVYVALPCLRFLKVVWAVAHLLTGGVFLTRPPIERKRLVTKTLRVSIESNVMRPPFDDMYGIPDEQASPRRSRTESAASSNSDNGETHSRQLSLEPSPYFNLALNTAEEGMSYLYHG